MTTQYPPTLPEPSVTGFSASVQMGAIRSELDTHQAQRRVFTGMPHSFSLSFVMDLADWADWQRWMLANAYTWFEMRLPSLYAGKVAQDTSLLLIRLTSNISTTMLAQDTVRCSVSAELAPSMIAEYLEAIA